MQPPKTDGNFQNGDDLQGSLRSLGAMGEETGLIELLTAMNTAGALAFRWETIDGAPVRVWFARTSSGFADYIFPIVDDLNALVAERFLEGLAVFTLRGHPHPQIWWRREARPNTGNGKPY